MNSALLKLTSLPGQEGEYLVDLGPGPCEISEIRCARSRIRKVKLMGGDFQFTEYVPFQESDVLDLPTIHLNGVSPMTLVLALDQGAPLDVIATVGPAPRRETRTRMRGCLVRTVRLAKGANSVTLRSLIGTFTGVVVMSPSVGVFIEGSTVQKTEKCQIVAFDAPRVLLSESMDIQFESSEEFELELNVLSDSELVTPIVGF